MRGGLSERLAKRRLRGRSAVGKIIGTLSESLGVLSETIIRSAGDQAGNGPDGARGRYLYSLECKKSGRVQLVWSTCSLERCLMEVAPAARYPLRPSCCN